MKKTFLLKILVIMIVGLEILVFASCNTGKNAENMNSSYDAIKTAYVKDPLNSEISFIYNAINNNVSEYPKTVPNFIDLPIHVLADAIEADDRISIHYASDDQYENGVVIAQEPVAGAAWKVGAVVNLTVNRKYSDINSRWGYMGKSADKLYLLAVTNYRGEIWSDGDKLFNGEIIRLFVDNEDVFFSDRFGVNKLDTQSVSRVLKKSDVSSVAVDNEKLYYVNRETDSKLYSYNMKDKTHTLVFDEPVMLFRINSEYIVLWNPNDIIILDSKSYSLVKKIHFENAIIGCYPDKDNVYIIEHEYIYTNVQRNKIVKYDIIKDEKTTVLETDDSVETFVAADDKIVFLQTSHIQSGIRYIDMRSMESKFFKLRDGGGLASFEVYDILFDGQEIIFEAIDYKNNVIEYFYYSISVFTGVAKEIDSIYV